LRKNEGAMIDLDAYRSVVGKIMYYATNIAPEIYNEAGELAGGHLSNPGEDFWKALERCVRYLTDQRKNIVFEEVKSIAVNFRDYDSYDTKDETDMRSISGQINTLGGMITNWTSKKQETLSLSHSMQNTKH
jgi:DNA replicative helicase MCM subunit Mcm2 (Cdc46/Mcm family)